MGVIGLSLKESMSKNIQAIMPLEEDKAQFRNNLIEFIENLQIKDYESEEFQKNLLKDFLQQCLPKQFINTNKRTDLAIYNGNTPDSTTGVLIEVKSLNNKSEMVTKERINSKAFQEIIHYYLQERIVYNNLEIKKCIITNGLNWFTLEAKELEKQFYKNKSFLNLYNKWRTAQLASQTTDFLYTEVIAPAIDRAIENGLTLSHFDLRDALKQGTVLDIKTSNLTQLYRFFSPENLLNKEIFTDSNKLNKGFYDELLYLMGLEETRVNNQKVISRLPLGERQSGSFVENVIDRLQMNDIPTEKQYDIAVQLTVVWINRILFLKLLESQLVLFNGEEKYKFLTKEMLPTFDDIYYLFFGVLAKKTHQRSEEMRLKFPHVPYLNSSLFEETELELSKNGISIDRLREHQIDFYSKTVLKGASNKRKSGKVNFLTYLFEFLNAYDFSTSIKHNKQNKNTLINASVLGLIFEKINGYSDGSFYTPGRITMYMSKNVVRKAVIQKVNEVKGWNCKNIYDIEYQINRNLEIAKEVSDIIDTIKICDPAVGSGHFLVSILNELIAIKSELKVLIDSNGRSINDIQCTVVNDELIIQDINGDNFIYRRGNVYAERIQKAIFLEKKKLIEGCLFGVDLNPNSVNICRLRLWIELLKHSYYYVENVENEYDTPQLITLPNIDINIKVGNSLLHKFDINEDLDKRFTELKKYTQLVTEYKSTNDKSSKLELMEQLSEVRKRFIKNITTPEREKVLRLRNELYNAGQLDLFTSTKELKAQRKKLEEKNKKLKLAELELEAARKNPLFTNALEWRMEFPEILDLEGNFVGFDVIIANPPYIYSMNGNFEDKEKSYLNKKYPLTSYQLNTFSLFIELAFLLLKENGVSAFIIPNTLLTLRQYSKLRRELIDKYSELEVINSLDKIFDDANIDNCIIFFNKSEPNKIKLMELENSEIKVIAQVTPSEFSDNDVFNITKFKNNNFTQTSTIINTIEMNSKKLYENYADLKDGLKIYEKGKGNPPQPTDKDLFDDFKKAKTYLSDYPINEKYKKFLYGSDINRYEVNFDEVYLEYGRNLAAPRTIDMFNGERILIRKVAGNYPYALVATYVNELYLHPQALMMIKDFKVSPLFILGCINSRIQTFWFVHKYDMVQRKIYPQFRLYQFKELRIPNCTLDEQIHLAKLVKDMIETNKNTLLSVLEKKEAIDTLNILIDNYVMDLFKLTEAEKEIVTSFSIES